MENAEKSIFTKKFNEKKNLYWSTNYNQTKYNGRFSENLLIRLQLQLTAVCVRLRRILHSLVTNSLATSHQAALQSCNSSFSAELHVFYTRTHARIYLRTRGNSACNYFHWQGYAQPRAIIKIVQSAGGLRRKRWEAGPNMQRL